MAKVTDAHKADRRRQILAAADACFARDGVSGATMQDISREAGLSAGAIYLYFKSKADLTEAIARAGEARSEAFHAVEGGESRDPFVELLRSLAKAHDPTASRLAVRLWGEAVGDERLRELHLHARANRLDRIRASLARVDLPRAVPADTLAQILDAAMAGLELQRALEPGADLEPALEALAALMRAAAGSDRPDPDAPVFVG